MAILKPHFQLTPLIGAGNLVGVSRGEDTDHIVVTLGPNMVSNFQVYNQKATKNWATLKANKFTSPVVFTKQDASYVGVINHKNLRKWNSETTSLDSVKNYGFTSSIHQLSNLPDGRGFIQYTNGYSELLDVGIDSRKEEKSEVFDDKSKIIQSRVVNVDGSWINVIVTECVKDELPKLLVYCIRLTTEFRPESHLVFPIKIKKGVTLLAASITDQVEIVTQWSDCQMIIYNALCTGGEKKVQDSYHMNRFSPMHTLAIAVLDKRHILMYGVDASEEGGLVIIFDTKFGLVDAARKLKSCCSPPAVDCLRDSSQVLLPVGDNLIVLPYDVKPTKLAAVFAKQTGEVSSTEAYSSSSWGSLETSQQNGSEFQIGIADVSTRTLYHSLESVGTSSHLILEQVFPRVVADEDLTGVISILDKFRNLPERLLVEGLKLAAPKLSLADERHVALNLLEKLLNIPFTDSLLLKPLRKLKLGDVVAVIEFIFMVLRGELESNLELEKALDWMCMMFDAHFTQLAICQDEKVQTMLKDVRSYADTEVGALECLTKVDTMVETLKSLRPKQEQPRNHLYAVEIVQLY